MLITILLCPFRQNKLTSNLILKRLCSKSSNNSTYQGTAELKRKPIGRRPRAEYHEYVPPPPPPPPKRKDHYHVKPKYWLMTGTKFGRKRDYIYILGGVSFTVFSFIIYAAFPDVNFRFQRKYLPIEPASIDQRELFVEEHKNILSSKLPINPDDFTASDAREMMRKQRFSYRTHAVGQEADESLIHHD